MSQNNIDMPIIQGGNFPIDLQYDSDNHTILLTPHYIPQQNTRFKNLTINDVMVCIEVPTPRAPNYYQENINCRIKGIDGNTHYIAPKGNKFRKFDGCYNAHLGTGGMFYYCPILKKHTTIGGIPLYIEYPLQLDTFEFNHTYEIDADDLQRTSSFKRLYKNGYSTTNNQFIFPIRATYRIKRYININNIEKNRRTYIYSNICEVFFD